MGGTWDQGARERAYTALCEAVSAAGRDGESLFLARLVLLLGERLADPDGFAAALAEAAGSATGTMAQTPEIRQDAGQDEYGRTR